jgi:hypothetical protein
MIPSLRVGSRIVVLAIATGVILTAHLNVAAMTARVEFDKTFDFKQVRSWAWHPQSAGDVIMARTPDDDAEAMKRGAEPWIRDEAATVLAGRKLQQANSDPDVTLTYYLLLSTGASAQTMGQFLPATTAWGLPPFAPATQSLQVMNQGSLVLDFSTNGKVVWRGVAQAQIKLDADNKRREALVREGVKDLLRRFPPKQ